MAAALTIIESVRNFVVIDGVQQFRISTVCTNKGELPDLNIFVHQIMESGNPAADVFKRVVDISDFDTYLNDRVTAVAAGATYWRSYLLTKFYTDIQVAVSAKTAIQDRVDELAAGYQLYTGEFETASDIVSLPTGDATLLQALNNTYNSAYTAYQTAVTAEAAAVVTKSTADTELTDAQTAEQDAQAVSEATEIRHQEMASAHASMSAFAAEASVMVASIDTFKLAYDTKPGSGVDAEVDTLVTRRNQFEDPARSTFLQATGDASIGESNHLIYQSEIQTKVVSPAIVRFNTAETEVRAATLALAEAEAMTTATYTALETAYDSAKAACPSWVPDNPFPPIS